MDEKLKPGAVGSILGMDTYRTLSARKSSNNAVGTSALKNDINCKNEAAFRKTLADIPVFYFTIR